MELAEIIGLRPRPGAGLLVTLTRRCPLSCAHCSTASTMAGEEPDAAHLLRFVESFAAADRPEVMMLTGGEPLLLPGLVERLALAARSSGTRSAVLTGAFFARARAGRGGRPPRRIMSAIEAVDHFSVSLDAFHEREVSRAEVFALLRHVLDTGVPVSVHAVGSGPDDPYLAGLAAETRRVFADRVPMMVNTVRAVGRAASWAGARPPLTDPREPLPCSMAAWPTVAFDGTVVACCNQETVDRRPVPGHLRLGHIAEDSWTDIRARALGSPALRMIRAVGPAYLRQRAAGGSEPGADDGYCEGCRRLGDDPGAARAVPGPAWALLDRYVADTQVEAGPVAVMRRHGCVPYAELVAP
jgi:Radical SAM superfamily/Iron-sulfur cluster-binding domain